MTVKDIHLQKSNKQLENRLAHLYKKIEQNGDSENGGKVLELIQKVRENDFIIGFCGHFSAGKSSMINELAGGDLLPSSPIPTSANVVKVKSGRDYARVYYKHKGAVEYPAPYDYEKIKSYAKDGDEVESIEISHSGGKLPEGVAIFDTPGIDSTDDAHRISTESALHLADVILYIMDYNHVQSELNFQFTKELKDRGKQVYLVVNQIDKHRDSELSFDDFKSSVSQAFLNWNVQADGIFFTSLRRQDDPRNEIGELHRWLQGKIQHKDGLMQESVLSSARHLIEEHIYYLKEHLWKGEMQGYEDILSDLLETEREKTIQKVAEMEAELSRLSLSANRSEEEFYSGLNKILDNAYLMPFETRELARLYVESVQPDFKVGLFFSKNKTEKEREERLQRFYEDIKEKVASQLDWHIKDFLIKTIKGLDLSDDSLLNEAQSLEVNFGPDILSGLVKQGAGATGDYILTYTGDVAETFKRLYRNKAKDLFGHILYAFVGKTNDKSRELESQLGEYGKYKEAVAGLQSLEERSRAFRQSLEEVLEASAQLPEMDLGELLKEEEVAIAENAFESKPQQAVKADRPSVKKPETIHTGEAEDYKAQSNEVKVKKAAGDLKTVQSLIAPIKGMGAIVQSLAEKAERLENSHFTVALFGAFSAGKSSFANALIGELLLPVSPNPTTATINKIMPPTKEYGHGTVIVKCKPEEVLLRDIQDSLKAFGLRAGSLAEAIEIIGKDISREQAEPHQKPHYSFLMAVRQGMPELQGALGQELRVGLEEFRDFVAREEKACFVEYIELFYSCPLTEKGITLVDTPGADSINARHTGVAFDYIKNADAVLFVTYYNHAFSKADREFLIQLGRVKDAFSMDKMFFIINAADLASSGEELETVEDYVGTQLTHYGIRNPRLYSVSSLMALAEKKGEAISGAGILPDSGMPRFEREFGRFIIEELTEMAIASAYQEIRRAHNTVSSYVESALQSNDVKQEKLKRASIEKERVIEAISAVSADSSLNALMQEIKELVFYIKQRIFLRYPDAFKESFNPSSLREDGRDIKKALNLALEELLQFIGYDLAQEMRATSLRIEKYLTQILNGIFEEITKRTAEIHASIEFSNAVQLKASAPEFETALQELERGHFKKALSLFKNAKSFFEKNEKKAMSDQIENLLQIPVSQYIESSRERLEESYRAGLQASLESLKHNLQGEAAEYFEGIFEALSDKADVNVLKESKEGMEAVLKEAAWKE